MHFVRRTVALLLALAASGCAPSPRPATPAASPSAPAVRVTPGVSRELAQHRAASLADIHYDLALDVTAADSVAGAVSVYFQRAASAGDLVLDFRGRSLHEVRANGRAVEDYEWKGGHVRIPAAHLVVGANQLDLRFASPIAAAGASVIRYQESAAPGMQPDTYLYTLLVPADANLLFPSFDQPDLKATFALELITPRGWRALANAPVVDSSLVGERAFWRFAPTRPISTYLAAFAAGPWAVWTGTEGGRPITLFARRSRAAEVDADTLIATNRRALTWLEGYFGVDYPFAKYDMLLAPAFPFGGMEHPGAVFYNESRFVFREPPTLPERLGRNATIYHEVAHQWFGDLVTMKWFDDLWLKEGFSTYMAARMQEALNPGTGAWKTFYLRNKPPAYGVDATRGTTPVWQALENLDLAKSNYGPIVYNKAPAILKQLNFWVGEEAFRSGLRRLLREHAYGNITWSDLLRALERSSGEKLDAFGEHYILRAGMPVVETVLRTEGGRITELLLVQRPARELEGDRGGWWPGKVRVRLGYTGREDAVLPVTFSGDTTRVAAAAGLPAPDFVFANDGDYGYGVFLPDARSAAYLAAQVGTLQDELLRAMTWGALWDLVHAERLPPQHFVELALRELPRERDEQIAASVLGRATTAMERYLPRSAEADALRARFERLLLARMDDPSLSYDLRKASLDALLEGARTPAALAVLQSLLAGQRSFNGEPLREPSRWAAVQALLAAGHPAADSLYTAERRRDGGPEAERRAFVTGAAASTAEAKAEYFRRYLEDPGLNEEWVTASLGAFNHPEHARLTLPYLRPALEKLPWIQQNRRIFFLPQWINAFVLGHSSAEALAVVDAYLAAHPELAPDLRRKVLHARDDLERAVRVRAAANR